MLRKHTHGCEPCLSCLQVTGLLETHRCESYNFLIIFTEIKLNKTIYHQILDDTYCHSRPRKSQGTLSFYGLEAIKVRQHLLQHFWTFLYF